MTKAMPQTEPTEPHAAPYPSEPPTLGAQDPFRAIAEYTYDWESWIDNEGRLCWLNPAVERIAGYTPAQCLNMADYPLPLVHEADRPAVADLLEQAKRGSRGNHFEFRVLHRDGSLRWAAISWQPISNASGQPLGYRTSVRDIDERKRMEAALRVAVQKAEEANRAKTQFLANVSHELRTPLQSIVGFAELLETKQLAAPSAQYVKTLLEQGRHLQQLVGDLLDLSALQAGALPLRCEPYQPVEVVGRALDALAPQAEDKGLVLRRRSDVGRPLWGDPRRIAQVVTNLVGNAIKYTPKGEVSVEVALDAEQCALVVVVDDTGPGLSDPEAIFEPFHRGSISEDGIGLGLAISRQLCSRMGGSLTASTRPQGGASFRAVFPGAQPGRVVDHFDETVPTAPPSIEFAKAYPLRVLVIDDVEPAREFSRAALGALGYRAEAAATADEGFRLAEEHRPNVVLVDIQMPDLDGWSVARGLRARLGSSSYLVALTADSLADDASRLLEVGFDGFSQKPLGIRTLQNLLVRAHARLGLGSKREGSDLTQGAALSEKAETPTAAMATLTCPPGFDAERWHELSVIEVDRGETLLVRMRKRVEAALPPAIARVEQCMAAGANSDAERSPAVHDLYGLLALIGAGGAELLGEACHQAMLSADYRPQYVPALLQAARTTLYALNQLPG